MVSMALYSFGSHLITKISGSSLPILYIFLRLLSRMPCLKLNWHAAYTEWTQFSCLCTYMPNNNKTQGRGIESFCYSHNEPKLRKKLYLIIVDIHSCVPVLPHLGSLWTCRLLSRRHLFSFAVALGDMVTLPTIHMAGTWKEKRWYHRPY